MPFGNLTYIAAKGLGHDTEMPLDLLDFFVVHATIYRPSHEEKQRRIQFT